MKSPLGIPPFYPAACKKHFLFLKRREHLKSSGRTVEIIQQRQQEDSNLIYVLLLFRYNLLVRKYSEFCFPCLSPVSLSPRLLYCTIPRLPVQPGCGAAPLGCTIEYSAKPPVYACLCLCVLLLTFYSLKFSQCPHGKGSQQAL